jgi:Fe-S oxidoreductase
MNTYIVRSNLPTETKNSHCTRTFRNEYQEHFLGVKAAGV